MKIKRSLLNLLTDPILPDRVLLASETLAEAAGVFSDALEMYAQKYGLDNESCAIESCPNDKFRVIEGEEVQVYFYCNDQNHSVWGGVRYSKKTGEVMVNFDD